MARKSANFCFQRSIPSAEDLYFIYLLAVLKCDVVRRDFMHHQYLLTLKYRTITSMGLNYLSL